MFDDEVNLMRIDYPSLILNLHAKIKSIARRIWQTYIDRKVGVIITFSFLQPINFYVEN